jgi:hypothetical protein
MKVTWIRVIGPKLEKCGGLCEYGKEPPASRPLEVYRRIYISFCVHIQKSVSPLVTLQSLCVRSQTV